MSGLDGLNALEDHLIKHKYTSRKKVNGKWQYTYPDDQPATGQARLSAEGAKNIEARKKKYADDIASGKLKDPFKLVLREKKLAEKKPSKKERHGPLHPAHLEIGDTVKIADGEGGHYRLNVTGKAYRDTKSESGHWIIPASVVMPNGHKTHYKVPVPEGTKIDRITADEFKAASETSSAAKVGNSFSVSKEMHPSEGYGFKSGDTVKITGREKGVDGKTRIQVSVNGSPRQYSEDGFQSLIDEGVIKPAGKGSQKTEKSMSATEILEDYLSKADDGKPGESLAETDIAELKTTAEDLAHRLKKKPGDSGMESRLQAIKGELARRSAKKGPGGHVPDGTGPHGLGGGPGGGRGDGSGMSKSATPGLDDLDALAKSGGPFIGPRGGKWADAKRTIPYDDKTHREAGGFKGGISVNKMFSMVAQATAGMRTKGGEIEYPGGHKATVSVIDGKRVEVSVFMGYPSQGGKEIGTVEVKSLEGAAKAIKTMLKKAAAETTKLKAEHARLLELGRGGREAVKNVAGLDHDLKTLATNIRGLKTVQGGGTVQNLTEAGAKNTIEGVSAAIKNKINAHVKKLYTDADSSGNHSKHNTTIEKLHEIRDKAIIDAHSALNPIGGKTEKSMTGLSDLGSYWQKSQGPRTADELHKAYYGRPYATRTAQRSITEWADQFYNSDALRVEALKLLKEVMQIDVERDAWNNRNDKLTYRELQDLPRSERDAYNKKVDEGNKRFSERESRVCEKMSDLERRLLDHRIAEAEKQRQLSKMNKSQDSVETEPETEPKTEQEPIRKSVPINSAHDIGTARSQQTAVIRGQIVAREQAQVIRGTPETDNIASRLVKSRRVHAGPGSPMTRMLNRGDGSVIPTEHLNRDPIRPAKGPQNEVLTDRPKE